MKCCGVDTYKDWAEYDPDHFTPYNQHSITDPIFRPDASRQPSVPASCCDPQKRLVMYWTKVDILWHSNLFLKLDFIKGCNENC